MKLLLQLIFREAWYHRARISLAVLTTVAMSCMIVWLIGGLGLMILRFEQDGANYLGHFQLALVPEAADRTSEFPAALLDKLRKNRDVAQVAPARQIVCSLRKEGVAPPDATAQKARDPNTAAVTPGPRPRGPVVIGIDAFGAPFDVQEGGWFCDDSHTPGPGMEGVIGSGAAASLGDSGSGGSTPGGSAPNGSKGVAEPVRVGDVLLAKFGETVHRIRIVGVVEQRLTSGGTGRGLTPATAAIYVSMRTATKIAGGPPRSEYAYVRLRDPGKLAEFKAGFKSDRASRESAVSRPDVPGDGVRLWDADALQAGLNRAGSDMIEGPFGAGIHAIIAFSTLASILIVFTTLSMGVSERTRVFAMLRTIGMPRSGIAALIFGESLILCLLGWLGGMIAGMALLQLTVWAQPEVFGSGQTLRLSLSAVSTAGIAEAAHPNRPNPIPLSLSAVGVAGIVALLGSLLAALLPAWRAARVDPLDGMNRGFLPSIRRDRCFFAAAPGLLLLAVEPVIVFTGTMPFETRMFLYTYIGLPALVFGSVLVAPATILLVEALFAPLLARLLGLRKELLAGQLGGHFWKTLGTTISLCVGLGLYAMFEIWGYSMLVPFVPSPTLPDTLAVFTPRGIPFTEIDAVRAIPGVDPDRFLPVALEQPRFSERQFNAEGFDRVNRIMDNAVLFGIDPDRAFLPASPDAAPLVRVDFEAGTLDSALEKLRIPGGRYCLIPNTLAVRADIKLGDKIELVLPTKGEGRGERGEGGRSSGRANHPETPRLDKTVEYEVCGIVSIPGWLWITKMSGVRLRGGRTGGLFLVPFESVKNDFHVGDARCFWFDRTEGASLERMEEAFLHLVDHTTPIGISGMETGGTGGTDGAGRRGAVRPTVRISTTESMTESIDVRANSVIQATAKMPLVILAISALGVMGTVAASVRTRRRELGVLRSLGVTRFALIRLILAEALLIAVAASLLSFGFGVLAAWCSAGTAKYVSFFGGVVPPLVIPVGWLALGFGFTLSLCLLAAIGPAIIAGRQEPARLLQEYG